MVKVIEQIRCIFVWYRSLKENLSFIKVFSKKIDMKWKWVEMKILCKHIFWANLDLFLFDIKRWRKIFRSLQFFQCYGWYKIKLRADVNLLEVYFWISFVSEINWANYMYFCLTSTVKGKYFVHQSFFNNTVDMKWKWVRMKIFWTHIRWISFAS